MNTHTLTCLNKKVTYPIIDGLKVDLTIQENPYGIQLEELFVMAARINKKRSFLFVSKLLGKHIPINPKRGLLTGALLAARYLEGEEGVKVKQTEQFLTELMDKGNQNHTPLDSFVNEFYNPVIIGFAETATALGHAFFSAFKRADFFHTTREKVAGEVPAITFEEEHSHATSHRVYVDEKLLNNRREIILVDDEITTGKTAVNIIRSIQEKYPRETYTVVSILDWRSEANVKQFLQLEKELGISIKCVSLLKGTVDVIGEPEAFDQESVKESITDFHPNITIHYENPYQTLSLYSEYASMNSVPYIKDTGRFGLSSYENEEVNETLSMIGEELASIRTGQRTLCLGTGEYMYVPMKISSHMGEGVSYHSTTRSPIYPVDQEHYGAKNKYTFSNPEDEHIINFVYNISTEQYDELFLFFERELENEQLKNLLDELKNTKISEIKIIYLSKKEGMDESD